MPTSGGRAKAAADEAAALLRNSLPGAKRAGREHVRRAERMASWIHERFGVRPRGWRQKHLAWVRDRKLTGYAPATRYHHYRTALKVAHALGRPQIVPGGGWATLRGEGAADGPGGRPMRLPPAGPGGDSLRHAEEAAVAAVEAMLQVAQEHGDEVAQKRAREALHALDQAQG